MTAFDSAHSGAQKFSLWRVPGYAVTMMAVTAAFGAWSLLLPLLPLAVLDSGGSAGLAGATTGVFMAATVATQMVTPRLLRSFGYRPVMAASAFMLGVPALGHLLGMDAWLVLLFSALRGVGFGALTVSESALVAEIVPLRYLGKATGTLGVFVGLSQMVFLPAGLAIEQAFSFEGAYCVAAAMGIFGMVLCLWVPNIKPSAGADSDSASSSGSAGTGSDAEPSAASNSEESTLNVEPARPTVPMWKLVAVPALSVTTLSMGYGAVSAFLPAAVREIDASTGAVLGGFMLSIVGGAAMAFRYLAGAVADRYNRPGLLTIPAQIVGFAGMAILALGMDRGWSVWSLVIGAFLFGGAFGIVQNEALLSMFARLPRNKVSEASAVWNIFFDAGTGLGSVLLAMLVVGTHYVPAFAAGAAIIVLGLVMTGLDTYLGAHRVSEYDNIKTRLKRLRKV